MANLILFKLNYYIIMDNLQNLLRNNEESTNQE